jgi:hypothetical protein
MSVRVSNLRTLQPLSKEPNFQICGLTELGTEEIKISQCLYKHNIMIV